MNASLTGQQKSVAIQEWTSWKQWALGHPDWLKYKDERTKEIENQNEKIAQLLVDSEVIKEMHQIITTSKEEKRIQEKQGYIALLIICGAPVILAISIVVINALNYTQSFEQINRERIQREKN